METKCASDFKCPPIKRKQRKAIFLMAQWLADHGHNGDYLQVETHFEAAATLYCISLDVGMTKGEAEDRARRICKRLRKEYENGNFEKEIS